VVQSAPEYSPQLLQEDAGNEPAAIQARTPRRLFWMRFKQDRLAITGAVAIIIMVVMAATAGFWAHVTGHPYNLIDVRHRTDSFGIPLGPDRHYWFGSDDLGRDLFVRVLYGARVSLRIGFLATGVEMVIGVLVGLWAGYRRGWVDTVLSRVMDLVLSVPFLLLGIALAVAFGPSERLVIFLISFFGWPYIARIVRGQTLSLRETQFVEAARSLGAPSGWIMFREILPNLIGPILIYSTLVIPANILGEAGLSFLGVGIQEPTPAWGSMLANATQYVALGSAWWYMVFPGLALFITVLGFNLLGDGLRDALDPRTGR
jgi:peptide/nickel transport system permease protein